MDKKLTLQACRTVAGHIVLFLNPFWEITIESGVLDRLYVYFLDILPRPHPPLQVCVRPPSGTLWLATATVAADYQTDRQTVVTGQ